MKAVFTIGEPLGGSDPVKPFKDIVILSGCPASFTDVSIEMLEFDL